MLVSVWVLLVVLEAEGVARTRVVDDEGSSVMWQLVWMKWFIIAHKMVAGGFIWVPEVE